MKSTHYFIAVALVLVSFAAQSQEKAWTVKLSGGPTIHYGDIMDHELVFPALDNTDAWNFSGSLSIEKRFSPIFSLRGEGLYGKLGGTRVISNRYFEADIFDLSLQARIDFIDLFTDYNPYRTVNVYGLLGVGLSNWESTLKDYTTNAVIRQSGGVDVGTLDMTTEGFVPGGLGVSFRLGEKTNLNLESTLRVTNSDMLDAAEGGSKYDMYSFTSLGFSYSFGGKKPSRRRTTHTTHRVGGDTQATEQADTTTQQEPEISTFEASINSEMPGEINTGQSFAVNLTINKGDISGPATIRQVFPQGFEVQPLALAGGDYNFVSQVFTVNWDQLPSNKEMTLTYRVKTNEVDGGTYPISGIFTYTQNANSKLLSFKNSIKVNAPTAVQEDTSEQFESGETMMEQGVVFRVQIRAKYRKKMSIAALKSRFNLNETIYEDYHKGYYIYTIGNYSTYQQARNKREELTVVNGINDAFVVAFRNGKRLDKLSELDRF